MHEKTNNLGFGPGPTLTGLQKTARRLKISNMRSRGIVLSKFQKQRRRSASRLLRSWSAPMFLPMQIVGFPIGWLTVLLSPLFEFLGTNLFTRTKHTIIITSEKK